MLIKRLFWNIFGTFVEHFGIFWNNFGTFLDYFGIFRNNLEHFGTFWNILEPFALDSTHCVTYYCTIMSHCTVGSQSSAFLNLHLDYQISHVICR